jgi:alkane 1-monooxygenase
MPTEKPRAGIVSSIERGTVRRNLCVPRIRPLVRPRHHRYSPVMRARPLSLFLFATASPMVLIGLAGLWGGAWPLAALLYMSLAAVMLDLLVTVLAADGTDQEFPAANSLLAVLGLGALAMLPLVTWAVAGPSALTVTDRLALFFAAGLWLGQVAHPAGHELIHRSRPLFWLGLAVYTGLLFGHHTSAHRLVHHRHVATGDDPNTARAGESFYRFLPRAWIGSFRQGWRAETALRGRTPSGGVHPYAIYLSGGALCLGLAAWIAGPAGVAVWTGLGLYAGAQILLSDYIQHYGLTRTRLPDGRLAPVSAPHSWNTPHWLSSALMLNAPRHSDHHSHPSRPFPSLRLPDDAPRLPWPLPLAGLIALYPPLWHRRMRPLLARLPAPIAKP